MKIATIGVGGMTGGVIGDEVGHVAQNGDIEIEIPEPTATAPETDTRMTTADPAGETDQGTDGVPGIEI
ncbi:MAG: hypothetical protein Q9172_007044 [Xanthocarpia lactea]